MYQYKRTPLDPDEQDRLVNSCSNSKEKLVVYTLLETGMRVSELANLKKENVKWQAGVIEIYGKGGVYGKQSKRRNAPLSPRVKAILEHYFALNNEVGFSVRTIQRIVKQVAEKASITKPVTPHVLRHTFSINAIRKGVNLRALQEALGHDHITTTEIYLNYSGKDIAEDFRKLWS